MRFHASDVQLSSELDDEYLQIYFSESEADECPYILLQNSFEFERTPCYFECHNFELSGHGVIESCELKPKSIEIDLQTSTEHLSVTFDETKEKIANMAWILDMIFDGDRAFLNNSGVPNKPLARTRP